MLISLNAQPRNSWQLLSISKFDHLLNRYLTKILKITKQNQIVCFSGGFTTVIETLYDILTMKLLFWNFYP